MKNQQQNLFEYAKNEMPIDKEQLLVEILPIIDAYFVGDIQFDGQNIVYRLPNEQIFLIKAESV